MFDRSAPVIPSRKILLLQGPVGPFFKELQLKLIGSGYTVKRVLFNFGDSLFASGLSFVRFTGTLDAWETWMRFEISENKPDCIIFFGSSRPAHKLAAFFEAVKSQSLLPGDFYVSAGRKEAIKNIILTLNDILVKPSAAQEAVT